MEMNNIINERKSSDMGNIVQSCGLTYGHLMKFISIKHLDFHYYQSWIDTIYEQSRQLREELTNKSYWNQIINDGGKLLKIRTIAIQLYSGENPNVDTRVVDQIFNQVHAVFPDINMLKSWNEQLKPYLLANAVGTHYDDRIKEYIIDKDDKIKNKKNRNK